MSRIKYGIDLGTTNSAIAEISKGVSLIIKNQLQKDTTPSCIGFSKRKGVLSGDRAYNQLKGDKKRALFTGKDQELWGLIKNIILITWVRIILLKSFLLKY